MIMPAEHEFTALEETFQFEAEAFDANGHAVEAGGLNWRIQRRNGRLGG